MKRQRFSVLVWNWQPPLCLSLNFLRSAMPRSASRRLCRSRLLWFIAPLTFSNHFSNCPICRALCKPAAVNEESSNWQTLVQFALHSQNKCVPCELADLTHDFSRPNFPACEGMPAEPVEGEAFCQKHCDHPPTGCCMPLFAQLHPKRVSASYTKDTTSSNE